MRDARRRHVRRGSRKEEKGRPLLLNLRYVIPLVLLITLYFNLPFFSYNIANESAARRNGISLNYRINHLLFSSHRSIHLFNKNIQASKDKFPFQRSSRIKRGGRRKLSRDVPLPRLPPPTLSSPLSFSRNHYILASS